MFVDGETGARQYGRVLTRDELRTETRAGRVVTIVGVSMPDVVAYAEAGQWRTALAGWVTGVPDGLTEVEWRAVGYSRLGDHPEDRHVLIEVSGVVQWDKVPAVVPEGM